MKYGDSLFTIGNKYGISYKEIKDANGLTSDVIMPGQVLKIPGAGNPQPPQKQDRPLWKIFREKGIKNPWIGMQIVIDKSDHTLSLFSGGAWLKSYHVEFGEGGLGDKEVAGDHKTPEGTFYVCEKSVLTPPDYYLGSRWIRLSYPNKEDAGRGLSGGLIDRRTYNNIVAALSSGKTPPQNTVLGGGIGIHGGDAPQQGDNWTWGCIGMSNSDIEDYFSYVSIGTPVTIKK
ncbi:MAG: L,D-transpeptidase family protein [Desulfocucumaceae bacterium]